MVSCKFSLKPIHWIDHRSETHFHSTQVQVAFKDHDFTCTVRPPRRRWNMMELGPQLVRSWSLTLEHWNSIFFCFGNPNLQAISTGWWWSESPVEFRSFFDVCVKSTDDPNPHIIGLTPGNPGWDDGKDLVDPRTSKDGMIWWFILTVKNDFQLKRLRATRKYPAG